MHSLVIDTFPPVWLKQLRLMANTAVSNDSNIDYKAHLLLLNLTPTLNVEAACAGDVVVNSGCYIATYMGATSNVSP